MRLIKPSYKSRTPIVNDIHYTDARIGTPQTTFNPGAKSETLPNGPPKFVQVPGKRVYAKGLTNKRQSQNL